MARAKAKEATLPRGYTAISSSSISWPNDDTKKGDMIQGQVIEFDTIKVKRGKKMEDVQLCKFECKDGTVYTIWESAFLAGLFEYEEGVEAAIIYDGMGTAKKGQNAPKLFRLGVKDE